MSKDTVEPERQMLIWRRVVCWISDVALARAYASAPAPAAPTRTHARVHECTRTRARAHTHTEICNAYCFSTATMVS